MFPLTDIQIIFEFDSYSFLEPDSLEAIRDQVFIIKDDDQITERTFEINVTLGDPSGNIPPATLQSASNLINYDYLVGSIGVMSIIREIPPSIQNISLDILINADDVAERIEAFQLTAIVTDIFPSTFSSEISSSDTQIVIIDNDGKILPRLFFDLFHSLKL